MLYMYVLITIRLAITITTKTVNIGYPSESGYKISIVRNEGTTNNVDFMNKEQIRQSTINLIRTLISMSSTLK